jgi:hypothetical protein
MNNRRIQHFDHCKKTYPCSRVRIPYDKKKYGARYQLISGFDFCFLGHRPESRQVVQGVTHGAEVVQICHMVQI